MCRQAAWGTDAWNDNQATIDKLLSSWVEEKKKNTF
jgi:hypothetical protein